MATCNLLINVFLVLSFSVFEISCFITWIEPRRGPLPGERPAPGTPWPLPREWANSTNLLAISPDFVFSSNMESCDIISQAEQRYLNLINPKSMMKTGSNLILNSAVITVSTSLCETLPTLSSDESYKIIIDGNNQARLESNSVWGALRALETFSQLIWQDESGVNVINETTISDYPRFKHRGFLLDSARHFVPIGVLKQNLDAMQYNKLNVFHWHLSDDQSFPLESKRFPNLTQLGAYHPKLVYTQAQVADIIEYARLRGIRVIPEIDSPGHTYAIGRAFNNLLSSCYGDGKTPNTARYPDFSAREILDPMNPDVYTFMQELFTEVRSVFKDEFIHLGMDEVYYACWNSSPVVAQFMKDNQMTEMSQFEEYYVTKILKIVKDVGYKYLIWQDPIENGAEASPDTVVQVWKDKELDKSMDYWRNYIVPIAQKGYQILLSSCWYLNYISYGQDWKKYYQCDPQDFEGTQQQKDLVIGGEAAMWGEYVDGTNILARIWPRASAVAERLWSDASLNDTDSAAFRLDQQRCRLVRRGIPAQPILNGFCGDYEFGV